MTRRILVLAVFALALAVPAISWADDGNGGSAPAAAHDGSRVLARLDRASARLDARFQHFSSRCLVTNAPKGCEHAASRFVHRLDRATQVLSTLEGKIKQKCSATSPPAACAHQSDVVAKIDALLSKIASDEAAIKAQYPSA